MVVFRRVVLEVRELRSGAILAKSVYEDGRIVYARNVHGDPAAYTAPIVIIAENVPPNAMPWWCDYGVRGKMVNQNLCISAFVTGRRAVALNPWPSGAPSDLDTIIDSAGYHKSGTIGKAPFTFTRSSTTTDAAILATFVAASDATIASIWLLAASASSPSYSTACEYQHPAPSYVCSTGTYASIYMPIWYWDVDVSVRAGIPYSVKITFSSQASS